MRPALYTFLVGVAIMAFVAFMLLQWPAPEPLHVCGGIQTTGPNGDLRCGPLPAPLPNGMTPLPDHAIDYR